MSEPLEDLIEALDDMYVKKLAPDNELSDQLTLNLKALGAMYDAKIIRKLEAARKSYPKPELACIESEEDKLNDLDYCISKLESLAERLKSRKR